FSQEGNRQRPPSPSRPTIGRVDNFHGIDSFAATDTGMAPADPGPGPGGNHLHSPLEMGFHQPAGGHRVGTDRGAGPSALAGSRADRLLLLLHLGLLHSPESLPGSMPPAPCLRPGPAADR